MTHITILDYSPLPRRHLIVHGGKLPALRTPEGKPASHGYREGNIAIFLRGSDARLSRRIYAISLGVPRSQSSVAEERKARMAFRLAEVANIENPREYSSLELEDLRHLLVAGGQLERDPHREHFYNLEGAGSAYYIHISPITGKVMLLARWSRQASSCYAAAEHQVA
jgi:hypothetical protein